MPGETEYNGKTRNSRSQNEYWFERGTSRIRSWRYTRLRMFGFVMYWTFWILVQTWSSNPCNLFQDFSSCCVIHTPHGTKIRWIRSAILQASELKSLLYRRSLCYIATRMSEQARHRADCCACIMIKSGMANSPVRVDRREHTRGRPTKF